MILGVYFSVRMKGVMVAMENKKEQKNKIITTNQFTNNKYKYKSKLTIFMLNKNS